MKEAAGEANMTVITIVLIGIVLVAGGIIIKAVMDNTKSKATNQDDMSVNINTTGNKF